MRKLVAIAGTFDRLHKGHRWFISQAFSFGNKVLIGLTSDSFVKGKFKVQSSKFKVKVNNYKEREKELRAFLKSQDYLLKAEIVKIDDVYGPAVENKEIEALAVTSDTLEGGRKVNRKRRSLGLTPLKLLQIPLVMAQDNERIASTRIRLGEIDRWGKVFNKIFNFQFSIFKISDGLRQELKKPLGRLLRGDPKEPTLLSPEIKKLVKQKSPIMIITVGDVATKLCNEIGLSPHLAVIDFKVERIKLYNSLSDLGFLSLARSHLARVRNPAGSITASTVHAVNQAMKNLVAIGQQQIIKVIGEEDLAGVPAILLSPLGSLVLYGQPGEGIVAVEVTEEKKQEILKILLIEKTP